MRKVHTVNRRPRVVQTHAGAPRFPAPCATDSVQPRARRGPVGPNDWTMDSPRPTPDPPVGQSPDTSDAADRRHTSGSRRRFDDRGGRRRADWPEDAGLTSGPGCGHEALQSLGPLDSGEYLWTCPACDRRFQTSRASRVLL
jgi:hypothetical protein